MTDQPQRDADVLIEHCDRCGTERFHVDGECSKCNSHVEERDDGTVYVDEISGAEYEIPDAENREILTDGRQARDRGEDDVYRPAPAPPDVPAARSHPSQLGVTILDEHSWIESSVAVDLEAVR